MNKNRNEKAGKIGHPWLSTLSLYKQLGSFSNDDGDGKKNGMHLKINTSAIVTLCDCPILFAFYNVGKGSYNWTGVCAVELNTEIQDLRLKAQVVIKTVDVVISRCCFAEEGTDLFISACRTCSARPLKFLICGVVVAVLVVDPKAP